MSSFAQLVFDHFSQTKKNQLLDDIRRLWQGLTLDRAMGLSDYFRDPGTRRAYFAYYLPIYANKIALLLRRLEQEGQLSLNRQQGLRLLDLGAGPLTTFWGVHLFGAKVSSLYAVDKSVGTMRAGADFVRAHLPKETHPLIELKSASLLAPRSIYLPKGPVDLITMAHVLNELKFGKDQTDGPLKLITGLKSILSPNGYILIVEPATKVASRGLMSLRDQIVEQGEFEVLAPCTGAELCPLLLEAGNWCFSELAWDRPKALQRIDEAIGFDKNWLKCSFLLLGHKKPVEPASRLRIVSGPMLHKGVLRRYLCTKDGLRTLVAPETASFRHEIQQQLRGQILDIAPSKDNGISVVTETALEEQPRWQKAAVKKPKNPRRRN